MDYSNFLNELYSLQDLKYKEFHSKLIMNDNLIGVRTKELKNIAKKIAKADYVMFFKNNKHNLYEETLIHGLTLGYLKLDFNKLKHYIDDFIPFIDNWAICDITATNLKIYGKSDIREICFNEIKKYITLDNSWANRFGYVLLLNYFIEKKYIPKIFKLCEICKDDYYVKMSVAWLISICYIKYKKETLEFFKNNKLDIWTYNKAVQKIIESNRVSIKDKNMLRGLKRK